MWLHKAGMVCHLGLGPAFLLLGQWRITLIFMCHSAFMGCSLLWLKHRPGPVDNVVRANIAVVFLNMVVITWLLDGTMSSACYPIWGLVGPLAAMVFLSRKETAISGVLFALGAFAVTAPVAWPGARPLPAWVIPWMTVANMLSSTTLCMITLAWFVRRLEDEHHQLLASRDRLRHAEHFESLGVLAGGIAHDFNNAFMAISGNLQLACRDASPSSPLRPRLDRARQALEQATELAHQLLAFSSGGAPSKARASVAETVQQAAQFVLSGSSVRLEFYQQEQLHPVVADLEQISRLVQHLVNNAAQAMPEGGNVTVRLGHRFCTHSQPPLEAGRRYVVLEVEDQGHGIPEHQQNRLFDPFFTTREGRSGMGLTDCYTIARDHKGHIEVESEPGCGSTFRVWLPASSHMDTVPRPAVRPDPEPAAPPCAAQDGEGIHDAGRILVMDDEPAVLEVLEEMLTVLGYEVLTTEDGKAAVEAWRQASERGAPPLAAIFDLTVRGGMGGVEAAQKLRALAPDARIVASSGYVNNHVLADYRQHGFDAVLRKPYRLDQLVKTLEETLTQR